MTSSLRVTFTDIAFMGDAIARPDGRVLFAPYAIPGEEAMVRVVKEKRDYLVGEVEEILTPSPHRASPPCPLFGRCSGCQWQHIAYPHQLELKRRVVQEQLRRIGKFREGPEATPHVPTCRDVGAPERRAGWVGDEAEAAAVVAPALGAEEPWHYRNHARFTVNPEGSLGFVRRPSREFLPVPYCYIMEPRINEVLAQLQGRLRGATQLNIRYSLRTGSYLIQPRLEPLQLPFPTGQSHYQEELLGRPFRIGAPCFFQVNTAQAERLVGLVLEALSPTGQEVVIDAYAGVGTLGILVAPYVKQVIAIEESAPALADAAVNARGLDNITFLRGRTEQLLWALAGPADAVILDPPRAGCHRQALEALLRLAPARVVYVSCDPATLARDLRLLADGGYALRGVQPLDMFPQTHHVECVATLSRP